MKYFWAGLFTAFEMIGMVTVLMLVFAAAFGDLRICSNDHCLVNIDRPPSRSE